MNTDVFSPGLTPLQLAGPEGLPKYLRLKEALLKRIESGEWEPGDQLPAEDVLARLSGLSLGTVQRSLRLLVEEGVLLRKHGSGTFVSRQRRPMSGPFHHFRFLTDDGHGILPIYTRVLQRVSVTSDGPWRAHLRTDHLCCIDRAFSIGNEFELFVQFYFCSKRFPELATTPIAELTGVSFKDLLGRRHQDLVVSYTETMRVQPFPEAATRALSLRQGDIGAHLEITALDANGETLYLQYAYIPPNDRRLILQP